MTVEDLYKEFIRNFPNFEPMVRAYYAHGSNALKVYTKQGKKLIFEINKDGFSLKIG